MSSLAVFKDVIWVKSIHLIKSCFKPEKEKIWKQKILLHKSPSKRSFKYRIHSFLTQADARGSIDIIYCI